MAKPNKRKAIIDDGMNPELIQGANFAGYIGIPELKKPNKIIIPTGITSFSQRSRTKSSLEAIGFNEMDTEFAEILIHPENFVEELKGRIFITPDCSLYRDMPLAAQITNIYRNRNLRMYQNKKG